MWSGTSNGFLKCEDFFENYNQQRVNFSNSIALCFTLRN